ncbi:hypothetical protein GCM10027276_31280 [Comamonas piscis]
MYVWAQALGLAAAKADSAASTKKREESRSGMNASTKKLNRGWVYNAPVPRPGDTLYTACTNI